jgi:hypothetical protein
VLKFAGMNGSIGTVGDAYDNAMMESAIGLFKTEVIDSDRQRIWKSLREVEGAAADWVGWFNVERLHSSTDYCPPVEWEEAVESLLSLLKFVSQKCLTNPDQFSFSFFVAGGAGFLRYPFCSVNC